MQLTQSVGSEIKKYIMNILGKDAYVVGVDGTCLSSPNSDEIGTKLELPSNISKIVSPQSIKQNGNSRLLIPLEYQQEMIAYLLLSEELANVKEYLPLIKSFAELLIQQFYNINKPVLDTTDQFIIKLINNASPADYPLYESEAKVLGYNLSTRRISIVVHLDGFWEKYLLSMDQPSFQRDEVIKNAKNSIETAINGFFSRNNDVIIGYLGNDKFVVFKAVSESDEQNVIKFLKKSYKSIFEPLKNYRIRNVAVGFGGAYSGIEGLVKSFRESDLSLELGQKLWGKDKSYYFGDLGILSILGDGDRDKKLQFANHLLNTMTNVDLNKTLECFFEQNLNLTETAEKLGVHRNTIIYRLNQISKILGADPRVFEQAMTIKIALIIRRLFN